MLFNKNDKIGLTLLNLRMLINYKNGIVARYRNIGKQYKDAAQLRACRNYYVQLLKNLAADERR